MTTEEFDVQGEFADKSTPLELSVARPEAVKKVLPDRNTNNLRKNVAEALESARQSEAPTEKNSLPGSVPTFEHFLLIDMEFVAHAKASAFQAVHFDCLLVCCAQFAIIGLATSKCTVYHICIEMAACSLFCQFMQK